MPDDDTLVELTRRILSTCDPDAISPKQVRQQLERELGCCLDSKKDLIRSTIEDFFLEAGAEQTGEEEVGGEPAEATDSQPKPKRKSGEKCFAQFGSYLVTLLLTFPPLHFLVFSVEQHSTRSSLWRLHWQRSWAQTMPCVQR